MRLSGDWLTAPGAQAVLGAVAATGAEVLFVGGCVRNAVLGAPVADTDLATSARPGAVIAAAEAAGLKPVPTGVAHGTVTVVADSIGYEVTTFRRDVATDGRRAVVAFTCDVAEDARRRDFTMNALYATADGTLVDPLGGLADARARRLRFVGDADLRIREDYLRILRFFRFHAQYGAGAPEPDPLAACGRHVAGLARLSAERIGAEMKKLLGAPDPRPALAAMAEIGALEAVLPGADVAGLATLLPAEAAAGAAPAWPRRLVALRGDGAGWRLSRAEAKRVAAIAAASGPAAAAAWRHGADAALDAALIAGEAPDTAEIARGAAARFPVAARDLPETGPALGARLRALEARWLAGGLRASREDLLG